MFGNMKNLSFASKGWFVCGILNLVSAMLRLIILQWYWSLFYIGLAMLCFGLSMLYNQQGKTK